MKKYVKEDKKEVKTEVDDQLQRELLEHYSEANAELTTRITHKERGFDVYDKVFRNYIDKTKWPFQARVPDGRASTVITRKTDRLIASKLQGKLIPRRMGSELGARIGTELLLSQWSFNDVSGDEPMLLKWRRMDLNCRKYGASFGICGWDSNNDSPTFEVLNNRDVLLQPGTTTLYGADWVQVRRYPTIKELEKINTIASTGDLYNKENLEKVKEMLKSGKNNSNYSSVNKEVLGLDNNVGGKLELVTEYRDDEFITFAPKGSCGGAITDTIVLRRHKNPFKHGQKPLVRLVYDQIDDDIYGRPELENVLPLIKTNWALLSQTLESLTNDLYTPVMVNPKRAQLDSIRFEKGARWLMETPGQDVVPYQAGMNGLNKFREHYGLITSLIMEGVGETAQDVSQIQQTLTDKTATEIKDMALLRSARDNANKLLLSQALSKMIFFWFSMDQQFITGHKLVRIVGKDAVRYLLNEGLSGYEIDDEGAELVSSFAEETGMAFDEAYETLRQQGHLENYAKPLYPEEVDGELLPKLNLDKDGKAGFLVVKPNDIRGEYDFIPDIEAMSMPNDQAQLGARQMLFESMLKVEGQLQQQGEVIKWKEVIEKLANTARIDDVEQFFSQGGQNEINRAGGASQDQGLTGQGVPQGGVLPNIPPSLPGQGQAGAIPGPVPGSMGEQVPPGMG